MPLLVFLGIAIVASVKCASLYPANQVIVQEGEGFTTYLVPDANFGTLETCDLKYGKNEGTFDVHPREDNKYVTSDFEMITTFPGSDECGAQVRNVSKVSAGTWQLTATDDKSGTSFSQLKVVVVDKARNSEDTVLKGTPGALVVLTCQQAYNHGHNYNFCEFVDLQTNKSERVCSKTAFYPEFGQTLRYLCRYLSPGSSELVERKIQVQGVQSFNYQEIIITDKSVVLSCNAYRSSVPYCVAVHLKSNQMVNLQNNILGHRYSSHKTNLNTGFCQLEIPNPVLANETGVWKIITYSSHHKAQTGCIFNFESEAVKEVKALKERVSSPQNINTIQRLFSIKCEEAPYKLEYCYLQSPDNKIQFADLNLFATTSSLGNCYFDNIPVQHGRWTCGYNGPDNESDIVQDIQVNYYRELGVEVPKKSVSVKVNDDMSLICRVVTDDPIKSCIFISPTRRIYHLTNSSFRNAEFGYYGRGLNSGDCGITLFKGNLDRNHGNWTCNVVIYPSSTSNYLKSKTTFENTVEVLME